MKTTLMAAFAALTLSTAAMADSFDVNKLVTKITVDNFEFKIGTNVGTDLDGLGDTWAISAGLTVLEYQLGAGTGDLFVFGRYDDEYADTQVGAEYTWTVYDNDLVWALAAEAAYDFEYDALLLRPNVNLEYMMTRTTDVFGEVGYVWDATNSFEGEAGYVEVGADFALSEAVSLRPSIIQPFDAESNDASAKLEFGLKF